MKRRYGYLIRNYSLSSLLENLSDYESEDDELFVPKEAETDIEEFSAEDNESEEQVKPEPDQQEEKTESAVIKYEYNPELDQKTNDFILARSEYIQQLDKRYNEMIPVFNAAESEFTAIKKECAEHRKQLTSLRSQIQHVEEQTSHLIENVVLKFAKSLSQKPELPSPISEQCEKPTETSENHRKSRRRLSKKPIEPIEEQITIQMPNADKLLEFLNKLVE